MQEAKLSIEDQIKGLRKLKKALETITYTVSKTQKGYNIKKGKKLVVIADILSQEWAERIIGSYAAAHKRHIEEIETIILCLENNMEQCSLNIFGAGVR